MIHRKLRSFKVTETDEAFIIADDKVDEYLQIIKDKNPKIINHGQYRPICTERSTLEEDFISMVNTEQFRFLGGEEHNIPRYLYCTRDELMIVTENIFDTIKNNGNKVLVVHKYQSSLKKVV